VFANPARLSCVVRGIMTTVFSGARSSVWKSQWGDARPVDDLPASIGPDPPSRLLRAWLGSWAIVFEERVIVTVETPFGQGLIFLVARADPSGGPRNLQQPEGLGKVLALHGVASAPMGQNRSIFQPRGSLLPSASAVNAARTAENAMANPTMELAHASAVDASP